MKKYLYIIIGGVILSLSPVFGLSLQKQTIVDTVISNIEQNRGNISEVQEKEQRNMLYTMIEQAPKKTHTIEIIDYLLEKINQKQQNLTPHEQDLLPEHIVNLNLTRRTRIESHNIVREEIGLEPYHYNPQLEQTAQERAEHLAKNMITKGTHARPGTQGRNTTAITKRFNDRGIDFAIRNKSSFSESIGYGYSNCPPDQICNKLADDTQSTRKFFMGEKKYNGPHYRAIVHPYFTELGIGIAVNNKRYYIVIHYGTKTITYQETSQQ